MLDVGVLVETLETATFWSRVERLYADVKAALEARLPGDGAGALPRLARLRDRLLALLHRRREGRPTTRWPVARRQGRRDRRDGRGRRDDHPPPRGRHRPQAVARRGDRRRSACRCCARSRPSSTRPASSTRRGAVIRREPRSFTFLVNPEPPAAARRPAAVVPVARRAARRRARGRGDVLARSAGDRRAWWPRRSRAATSWSPSAATGCSRRSPAPLPAGRHARHRPGRPRQRLRPDARRRPTTRPGRRALLLDGPRPRGRPRRRDPARRRRALVAGSVYAGVDARAAAIVDRARRLPAAAAVPLRRRPLARSPTGPARYRRRRRRRRARGTTRPPSSSPTRPTTARACGSRPPPCVDDGLLDVVVIEAASQARR